MKIPWFRRKKQPARKPLTAPEIIQVLRAKGIDTTEAKFSEVVDRQFNTMKVELAFPELMDVSSTAELGRTDSGYVLFISYGLGDGMGNVPSEFRRGAMASASVLAAISEIAKDSACSAYVLQPHQRVPLGEEKEYQLHSPHPLAALFRAITGTSEGGSAE